MMTGGDAPTLNLDRETVSNMDSPLRVSWGWQQRSNMEEVEHPGPAVGWRRQIGWGLEDCEPVESAIWCSAVRRTNLSTCDSQLHDLARGSSPRDDLTGSHDAPVELEMICFIPAGAARTGDAEPAADDPAGACAQPHRA